MKGFLLYGRTWTIQDKVPMFAAAVCGVASGVTAAAALTFKRDRAVVLALTLLLGLFVRMFTIAELGGH